MEVCCIIKPSGLRHTEAIIEVLEDAGMIIWQRKEIIYTNELAHQLYDHMSPEAQDDIAKDLEGKPGLALRIEVPSLESLLDVAGRESDPRACAFGTIRWRFGTHENPAEVGGTPWWQNAFHRPIDIREAKRDTSLVFSS
jgi:nucleoside diphosphate kinase